MPDGKLAVRGYAQKGDETHILEIRCASDGQTEVLELFYGQRGSVLEPLHPSELENGDGHWRRFEFFHREAAADKPKPELQLDLVSREDKDSRLRVRTGASGQRPEIKIGDCGVRYFLGRSRRYPIEGLPQDPRAYLQFSCKIEGTIFGANGGLDFDRFQLIWQDPLVAGVTVWSSAGTFTQMADETGDGSGQTDELFLVEEMNLADEAERIHFANILRDGSINATDAPQRYVLSFSRRFRPTNTAPFAPFGFENSGRIRFVQQQIHQDYNPDEVAWRIDLKGVPDRRIFELWNENFAAPYIDALHTVRDGRPISLIPTWEDEGNEESWAFSYKLVDQAPTAALKKDLKIKVDPEGPALELIEPIEVKKATFEGMIGHRGEAIEWQAHLVPLAFDEDDFEPLTFRIRARGRYGREADPQRCRLGSLDLVFSTDLEKTHDQLSTFEGRLRQPGMLPAISIDANLPLIGVAPGGQDPLPGEEFAPVNAPDLEADGDNDIDRDDREQQIENNFRRQRPVLVDLEQETTGKSAFFVLQVEEDAREGLSQIVRLELAQRLDPNLSASALAAAAAGDPTALQALRSEASALRHLIVLDRDPFLVARVDVPPLAGQASAETNRVGNWSSGALHGASWELAGSGDGFDLFLPPQGVGEAMEKGRDDDGYEDIEDGEPADFRFTPIARFNLLPSYYEQRFAEAPWNLRRLLGYPGQRDPGAGLNALHFEMLYGLSCDVEPRFLRLAEIAARLGAVPGRQRQDLPWEHVIDEEELDQEELHDEHRLDWSQIYSQVQSRLAVLEPWDSHQPDTLTLDDGVRYEQRKTALLRYPIPNPAPGDTRPDQEPFRTDGLAGGWSWGFESANILEAVMRDPVSSSGQLSRPYFSALGGWGFQKASFDKDLSTIYADTAMGRTFFYSLERIGRIGVFWNLAKHVIIYERTVVPSAQFAAEQDPLLGRAVVRKVDEYVEILQPERRYPEFGAPPQTRGFVSGIEFKSIKIRVNSRWGADVRRDGWQVPLWNRRAAADKPEVYPKPQILIDCLADPQGPAPTVQLLCAEPEKLVFYTSTRPEDDTRTDLWQAVRGVDYADQPAPQKPNLPTHAAHMDRPLPSDRPLAPGFSRFTYAVERAERGVDLTASRSDEFLGAVLQNVTMMRARPVELNASAKTLFDDLVPAQSSVECVLENTLAVLPSGELFRTDHLQRLVKRLEKELQQEAPGGKLTRAFDRFKELSKSSVQDLLCKPLRETSVALFDRFENQLAQELNALQNEVSALLRERLLKLGEFNKETFKDAVTLELDKGFRQFDSILLPLATGLEDLDARLDDAESSIERLRADALTRLAELKRLAAPPDDLATLPFELLRQRVSRLRSDLESRYAELESLFDRALNQVGAATAGPVGQLAKTVRDELIQIRQKIREDYGRAVIALGKIDCLLELLAQGQDEVRDEIIRYWTDEISNPIEILLETLHREIRALIDDEVIPFKLRLDGLTGDAKRELELVHGRVADLKGQIETELHDIIDGLADTAELQAAINAVLEGLRQQIQSFLGQGIDDLRRAVLKAQDQICEQLGQHLQAIFNILEPQIAGLVEAVRDALDNLIGQPVERIQREIEGLLGEVQSQVLDFADQVRDALEEQIDGALGQLPDNTLRLLRAFGDAPRLPKLDFNRQQLAYFFDEAKRFVETTPVTALMDRVGQDLKALGLRIPTEKLFDRVLPNPLENFDLSQIFPDFGGIKLDNLFDGLKMPSLANDNVKLRHGSDPQSQRAWAEAEVFVPLTQKANVFAFGPLAVQLQKAEFEAHARIEADLQGQTRQEVRGEIRGDWQLSVGGTVFVTFRDTAVRFDNDGRLRFDLAPERVEMNRIMAFLSDLMDQIGYDENGLKIEVIKSDSGLPLGVDASFSLPPFDAQFGVFGISDVSLGAGLRLLAYPEFEISTHFFLGRKNAPFSLTIFILTGGGWLDLSARYRPLDRQITTGLTLGLVAGAAIGFKFGPIKGGVSILFGLYAEYTFKTGGRDNGLTLAIMLLVRGEVRVLSFITVGISLLLEARYQSNGSLVGSGTLTVKIKISWCFTIKAKARVRYVFAKGSGGGSRDQAEPLALNAASEAFAAPVTSNDFAKLYIHSME